MWPAPRRRLRPRPNENSQQTLCPPVLTQLLSTHPRYHNLSFILQKDPPPSKNKSLVLLQSARASFSLSLSPLARSFPRPPPPPAVTAPAAAPTASS